MKVLYDYLIFYDQIFGGISNSFVQLIRHLPQEVDFEIAVAESDNIHLRDSGLKDVPSLINPAEHFILHRRQSLKYQRSLYKYFTRLFPSRTSLGRNKMCSVKALKQGNYDVFHPTFFSDYFLPYLNGKPFVLTVHDMIPEYFFRRNSSQAFMKRMLIKEASHIVAVSQHTKEDLMDVLQVPDEMITVIHHGASELIPRHTGTTPPLVADDYLLYVGHRKGYKNFETMLRALIPVLQHHPELKLVCTGPAFTTNEQRLFVKLLGGTDRLIHLRPDDRGLANLYAHARCFIFPSLYEGFGIPILEAWQARCPVLLNHTSCFPEIAGEAAVYFHLTPEQNDLAAVIENFLSWPADRRQSLVDIQTQRLALYDWQQSSRRLAEVYSLAVEKARKSKM